MTDAVEYLSHEDNAKVPEKIITVTCWVKLGYSTDEAIPIEVEAEKMAETKPPKEGG